MKEINNFDSNFEFFAIKPRYRIFYTFQIRDENNDLMAFKYIKYIKTSRTAKNRAIKIDDTEGSWNCADTPLLRTRKASPNLSSNLETPVYI